LRTITGVTWLKHKHKNNIIKYDTTITSIMQVVQCSSEDIINASIAKRIDTRGMSCPYPSFEAVKALSTMKSNEILEVITDSEESALDSIPKVCERRGYLYAVIKDENIWYVRIMKR
jgi:tRNA 2-thiouridine synthesizing protein A